MNGSAMQSALREMRAHFSDPRVFGIIAIVATILGFAGPFATFEELTPVPRLLYWSATVAATYAVGYFFGALATYALRERVTRPALLALLVGLVTGPPVTLTVLMINWLTFGFFAGGPIEWLTLLGYCTLVTVGINAIALLFGTPGKRRLAPKSAAAAMPAILERVPVPQRGALISLSVADHYVEVTTSRGRALILMRLGDAMREASPVRGLQIHRSHWVALEAVKRVTRQNGKATAELNDGRSLPVSRGYLAQVKQAGLIV